MMEPQKSQSGPAALVWCMFFSSVAYNTGRLSGSPVGRRVHMRDPLELLASGFDR